MKPFLRLGIILLAIHTILPTAGYASYLMAPSTEKDLPYSVQTRNLLKHLFNNRTVIGGQVIAVKGSKGKQFSGNYLDVGELGGVKKDDVFALFTPQGEPVGFAHVVETQHYTSTFEFMELTVEPSDNLIAKRVTREVSIRLPKNLMISPDMRNWKMSTKLAGGQKKSSGSPGAQQNGAAQTGLPPLPSNSTMTTSSGSNLPSLPSNNDNGTGNALPPLPGSGVASTDNTGLTPLPMNDTSSPGGTMPALPTGGDSGNSLPPLSGDNGGGLPPLGTDTNSSGLPSLPSDNSTTQPSLPSTSTGLPPLSNDVSAPPMSSTGAPDSGLPALPPAGDVAGTPALPENNSSNAMPALPGNDSQPALPALGAPDTTIPPAPGADSTLQTLPSVPAAGSTPLGAPASTPGDMSLPPLPGDTPANQGTPMLPPQSSLPLDSSNGMASSNGLPGDVPAVPPSLENNAPPALADMSLPPIADSSLPGQPAMTSVDSSAPGLPPVDNSSPPALADMSLPPASDNALPGQSTTALPPSLNPPAMEDLSPPSIASGISTSASTASHSSNLGLPAVPTDVQTGFLQDIPTLSPAKKPAA